MKIKGGSLQCKSSCLGLILKEVLVQTHQLHQVVLVQTNVLFIIFYTVPHQKEEQIRAQEVK